jgi:hypothetical protein
VRNLSQSFYLFNYNIFLSASLEVKETWSIRFRFNVVETAVGAALHDPNKAPIKYNIDPRAMNIYFNK